MSKVKVLDQELINQIAAGEVVERPASVVKELVENALDAGADAISIEVEDGGIGLIRVSDNGCGMAADDLKTAILRHATSKIASVDDLFAIRSLGFRGEALPSIISVSRSSVFSRHEDAGSGAYLVLEGGQVLKEGKKGLPVGTTIEVRDLFFNTPARKKFLKTTATEQRNIVDVVSRYALASPQVKFNLQMNGRTLLKLPADADLPARIVSILGKDCRGKMVPFVNQKPGIRISGYVAGPELTRPTRNNIYPFVNGRAVRDTTLTTAMIEGFRGYLMQRRFPVAILFVEIDPEDVDVNVHPAKAEVRFRHPSAVFGIIAATVRDLLEPNEQPAFVEPVYQAPVEPVAMAAAESYTQPSYMPPSPRPVSQPLFRPQQLNQQTSMFSQDPRPTFRYDDKRAIGLLNSSYILLEDDEALYILDQHAAHERVNYQALKDIRKVDQQPAQTLMQPMIMELSRSEFMAFEDIAAHLNSIGLECEIFGESAVSIRSIPVLLRMGNIKAIIMELLHGVIDGKISKGNYLDDILASIACHKSIKAGDQITVAEQNALLKALDEAGSPTTCPHGRPIYKKISFYEIEKWIGRRP